MILVTPSKGLPCGQRRRESDSRRGTPNAPAPRFKSAPCGDNADSMALPAVGTVAVTRDCCGIVGERRLARYTCPRSDLKKGSWQSKCRLVIVIIYSLTLRVWSAPTVSKMITLADPYFLSLLASPSPVGRRRPRRCNGVTTCEAARGLGFAVCLVTDVTRHSHGYGTFTRA